MSPALERRLLDIANYVKRSVQYIVRVNDDEEFLGQGVFALDFTAFAPMATSIKASSLIDEYCRIKSMDFEVHVLSDCIHVCGFWRSEFLMLRYSCEKLEWLNEAGENISQPYPDGDLFERMAAKFYPVLQGDFAS